MNQLETLRAKGNLLRPIRTAKSVRPPRKRIRQVSPKREKEGAIYRKTRKKFLRDNPYCEAVVKAAPCTIRATDIHHMKRRGRNYLNQDTFFPVCRNCHIWIETHANQARELGWILPR